MIEEEELDVADPQTWVNDLVKEYTLAHMK